MNNTIDKFGRRTKQISTLTLRGRPGIGFLLTSDGNYDIRHKTLKNVSDPVDGQDSATRGYVDNRNVETKMLLMNTFEDKFHNLTEEIHKFKQSLEDIRRMNIEWVQKLAHLEKFYNQLIIRK